MADTVKKEKRQAATRTPEAGEWYIIDAADAPLGRIATRAAELLQGKHRVDFARHKVAPVHVVITNSDKLQVTGEKMQQKKYHRYSGYPGGLRTRTLAEQMSRDSRVVIQRAVAGMLPKNNLRDRRMLNLKVYAGADHPHTQVGKTDTSNS